MPTLPPSLRSVPTVVPAVLLAFLGFPLIGAAQPPESPAIAAKSQLLESQARLEAANVRAPANRVKRDDTLSLADEKVENETRRGLKETEAVRREQTASLRADVSESLAKARRDWRAVAIERAAFDEEVARSQALYGFDWANNRPPTPTLGAFAWAAGGAWLAMLGVSVWLARSESRHWRRSRRRIRATAAALLIASLILPASTSLTWAASFSDNSLADIQRQIAETNAKLSDARARAELAHEAALRRWQSTLGPNLGPEFVEQEREYFRIVSLALEDAAVSERLNRDLGDQEAELKADRLRLQNLVEASREAAERNSWLQIGLCGLLWALGVAPLAGVRVVGALSQRRQSRICPRCLSVGKLVGNRKAGADTDPVLARVECSKCRFRIPISELSLPRFCFPAVGVRGGGKTQWLLASLIEFRKGLVSLKSKFANDPLQLSAQVNAMLAAFELREPPPPTVVSFPEPLTFKVDDSDPKERMHCLASLFDFSGESMSRSVYDDEFRERSLRMDGFLFFLDPTQVDPSGRHALSLQQSQVSAFYDQLRAVRGGRDKEVIRVPLAVCVPKFDLLINHALGAEARKYVAELRKKVPENLLTLELLWERSDFCRKLLPKMFQGWEVDSLLRQNFGSNIMYFPMTSVNLRDKELGRMELKGRPHEPFGVLEPFFWLLHMNGYSMFDDADEHASSSEGRDA